MKIVVPNKIELPSEVKHKITALGGDVFDDTNPPENAVIDRIKDAEIILAKFIQINRTIIDAAPKLKYIIVPAAGHEWVDSAYAASRGITTCNCPTYNIPATAEYAVSLMLTLRRKIVDAAAALPNRQWLSQSFRGSEVGGKTLAVIGYGHLGKYVAKLARGLGMQVAGINSSSSSEAVDQALRAADVICVCLPLTGTTKHFIDKRRLKLLKPTSLIINVSRGKTIDEQALIEALSNHTIAGAGLDVFGDEPFANGIITDSVHTLAVLPNVIATPHIAANTVESSQRLNSELMSCIDSCLLHKPMHVVAQPKI